jgi:predicted SAM-dependent methyltransferase
MPVPSLGPAAGLSDLASLAVALIASGVYAHRFRPDPPRPSSVINARRVGSVLKDAVKRLRDELKTSAKRVDWLRRRPGMVDAYQRSSAVRKLHLGCGPVILNGWLNADLRPRRPEQIYLDVTERFPFEDNTFDYILSEHMIGDLTYAETGTMLAECLRVLRPGGCLRISTPSLARLAELYTLSTSASPHRYVSWSVEKSAEWADAPLEGLVINNFFQEYRFVYDHATLRHVLERAGFVNVTEHQFGRSPNAELDDVESHGRVLGDPEISQFESVTMEAFKR